MERRKFIGGIGALFGLGAVDASTKLNLGFAGVKLTTCSPLLRLPPIPKIDKDFNIINRKEYILKNNNFVEIKDEVKVGEYYFTYFVQIDWSHEDGEEIGINNHRLQFCLVKRITDFSHRVSVVLMDSIGEPAVLNV